MAETFYRSPAPGELPFAKGCWWWPKDWRPKRWRSRCGLFPRGQLRRNGGAVPFANLCAGIRIILTSTSKTDKLTRAIMRVLAWFIAVGDGI
ncbi:hypothetical protein Gotur_035806 [Gossypium turneri]